MAKKKIVDPMTEMEIDDELKRTDHCHALADFLQETDSSAARPRIPPARPNQQAIGNSDIQQMVATELLGLR